MNSYEQLLEDLEAERDMAYMDAKDARVKADTLGYAAGMLRNTIHREAHEVAAEGTLVAFERNLDNSGRLTFTLKSLPYNGALGDKFLIILAGQARAALAEHEAKDKLPLCTTPYHTGCHAFENGFCRNAFQCQTKESLEAYERGEG